MHHTVRSAMVTRVDSHSRARAPCRPVTRCRGYRGPFTVLLFSLGMLFLPLLDASLSTYHIASWVRNIVQFYLFDKPRTRGATPGCTSNVVSAAAWPPRKKSSEQSIQKGDNHPEKTGDQGQNVKQEEQLQSGEHLLGPQRPTSLFRENTTTPQHFLQHTASDTLQTLRHGSFKFSRAADSPTTPFGRVDDRLLAGHDVPGTRTGRLLCDMRRIPGCQANSDVSPLPIFSMLVSTSRDYTCTLPVEDDSGGEESEDEFRAASQDESAALCLTADHQCVRRSWSILEPLEGSSTAGMSSSRSEFSTRSLIGRKSTASLPGKLSPSVGYNIFSFQRPRPLGAGSRGGVPPLGDEEVVNPELFTGVDEDESVEDEVDVATDSALWDFPAPDGESKEGLTRAPDEVDAPIRGVQPSVEGAERSRNSWAVDAVYQYQVTKDVFRATTQGYAERMNTYCTLHISPFELHPSGCAKHNIASLVEHVESETSLLYSTNLSYLLHFVVHLLWRGMRLGAACYPEYEYSLGPNQSTVFRLPHFIRIFKESLAAIAREPTTDGELMQRLDAACKAQSAAAQGEAALGAVGSILTSGLTTNASELVDVIKVGDLLADVCQLPLMTGRLLLLLADLCRTAFEMSEPLAQSVFCKEKPTDDTVELDPAVEESMTYCRVESTKFVQRYEEVQQAAKNVAQHALVIYNKLLLLEILPEKTTGSKTDMHWD